MRFASPARLGALLLALVATPAPDAPDRPCRPDEGLWPFWALPRDRLAERFEFRPDPAWFERLQLASVRIVGGRGSGAFVSETGLVLTNHHVVLDVLEQLSANGRDLLADGFLAATRAAELPCPDLAIEVLVSWTDVSERVAAAPAAARRNVVDAIATNASAASPDLVCRVRSFDNGSAHVLLRYRRHRDVRLVWAPEQQTAFFGGDSDNFSYPRYGLDVAMLRVWDDDAPLRPDAFLPLDASGPDRGEPVFVVGSPLRTSRHGTVAQLEARRDDVLPVVLRSLRARRHALERAVTAHPHLAATVQEDRFRVDNALRAYAGELDALRDERLLSRVRETESRLVAATPDGDAAARLDRVRALQTERVRLWPRAALARLPGDLAGRARRVLALLDDDAPLPDVLASLSRRGQPIEPAIEIALLELRLQLLVDEFGAEHAIVATALGDATPGERARQLVDGTMLADPARVSRFVAGGREIAALRDADPLLAVTRALDATTRVDRERYGQLRSAVRAELGALAELRRAAGMHDYPDANGTLRFSYGIVDGYESGGGGGGGGRRVPYKTTFGGLFARHDAFDGEPPYALPARLLAARERIRSSTPLDFVCTADIAAGHSGSPVVDRSGALVGVVFDGNRESLGNRYVFDDRDARAVCVHARALIVALRDVYSAASLLAELVPE